MAIDAYQHAVVTGASSGIGAATARALCQRGLKVTAIARRVERLEQLQADCGCTVLAVDLRDSDAIYEHLGGLDADILVNNAGIGRAMTGLFDGTPQDVDTTIGTNVTAIYHVIKALAPRMIDQGRGHIINIGSVAGLYPINSAVYGGSKGAVHSLTQNLRLELHGSGVRVSEICPGRVATEFFSAASDDPSLHEQIAKSEVKLLAAEDVAKCILFALDAPLHVNIGTIELMPTDQAFGGTSLTPSSASKSQ